MSTPYSEAVAALLRMDPGPQRNIDLALMRAREEGYRRALEDREEENEWRIREAHKK